MSFENSLAHFASRGELDNFILILGIFICLIICLIGLIAIPCVAISSSFDDRRANEKWGDNNIFYEYDNPYLVY